MPGMSAAWEKRELTRQLRDTILQLCKSNHIYGGQVEVDGIICITGKSEGQEIVLKIHERTGGESHMALTEFLSRPRDGWTSIMSNSSSHDNDPEDYSIKRPRMDESFKSTEADSYPNLKQHLMTPSRDLRDIQDFRGNSSNRDTSSAKDLSISASSSGALDMSPKSPQKNEQSYRTAESSSILSSPGDNHSVPHSPSYANQFNLFPITSTPTHSIFPRRIPLKNDRWSPSQPLPTVPECKPCGYTFNTFEILSDHNEAVHSVFTCQYCYKTFTSRSNLERHSRLHSGHRPYICAICGKSFSRKDHLSNHATKHAYKCGTCSKRFSDKTMLISHYNYDHNATLTSICDYCNKGFSSSEMYEEHLKVHPQCVGGMADKIVDGDMMPQNLSTSPGSPHKITCSQCEFTTADKLTLLKHQIMHQDNARCYTCLACAKMFADPLRYSDHLLVHSNESNIFECCLCRQICPSLNSLRRHESTHLLVSENKRSSPDQYTCPKCDKTFSSEFNLDEHMELHSKSEEAFVCTICQQEFETYSDICSHIEQEGHYAYSGAPAEGSNEGGSSKNKRKRTLPKSIKQQEELGQESDVEFVQPESPDEAVNGEDLSSGSAGFATNGEFVITENPAPVIEVSPDSTENDSAESPATTPIKQLLSQAIRTKNSAKSSESPEKTMSAVEAALTKTPQKRQRGSKSAAAAAAAAKSGAETNNNSMSSNNNVLLSPKLMNVEIPPGPYTCSVCTTTSASFQELEMHCFSEHNRSPCMFCTKTFAQKANRDRHVCLHTGEKPYGCPNCNEKFSRGDKLKIHRMRAHQTAFPALPTKGKDGSSARDTSVSPSVSPSGSQDSSALYREEWGQSVLGAPSENMYSAGEWAVKRDASSSFVAATGEWSVKEELMDGEEGAEDLSNHASSDSEAQNLVKTKAN